MLVGMGAGGESKSRAEVECKRPFHIRVCHLSFVFQVVRCRNSAILNGDSLSGYLHSVLREKMPRLLQFHKDFTVLERVKSIATVRRSVQAWEREGVDLDLEECKMMLDEAHDTTEAFAQFWNLVSNEDTAIDDMVTDLKAFVKEFKAVSALAAS
jgi:hypothetical protein